MNGWLWTRVMRQLRSPELGMTIVRGWRCPWVSGVGVTFGLAAVLRPARSERRGSQPARRIIGPGPGSGTGIRRSNRRIGPRRDAQADPVC
jgi:hypothetical protein